MEVHRRRPHPLRQRSEDRRGITQSNAAVGVAAREETVNPIERRDFLKGTCKRNIEMTPLCKIEATLPRVLGSRERRRGGVVDEQAGVQPS